MPSTLPPPVTPEIFRRLQRCSKNMILPRLKEFLLPLRTYLNGIPILMDIQERRKQWRKRIQSRKAFGDFRYQDQGWQIYNNGGKNEVQLNVGMFKSHLRIGMGFDFGLDDGGSREMVAIGYAYLSKILREDPAAFTGFILENELSLEFIDYSTNYFKIVPVEKAAEFFINLPKNQNPRWLFLGRILTLGKDDEILENPSRLDQEFEQTFTWLLPYWEEANLQAYGIV